ncbi:MAG: DUF1552 domain-containing protein [bacterium]|nr:DUF1552 domain-containing protein [bacterium]
MKLNRRTALRGIGAALALPWLETLAANETTGGKLDKPPKRAAFLFMPNGVSPKKWTPTGEGEDYELSPMLQSLGNVKDDFSLIENLWHSKTIGRNGHWPKVPAWLSGGFVVRTSGRDMDTGGISADQLLAQKIGAETPLPSLELGLDEARTGVDNIGGGFTRIYGSHIAWRDPHTPVPKEIIPRLAFDRLFRTGNAAALDRRLDPKQAELARSLQNDDASVLDLVLEDARDLRRKVSGRDQAKLDEYLESVRSVEQRIEASLKPQKRWINKGEFPLDRPGMGIPGEHAEHTRVMLEILLLAFWTDTTRIATFMFGDAQSGRNFSFLPGVKGSYHSISHHRNQPDMLKQYEAIGTWHVEQFAWFLERMKSLDEGGTSLLDNSMVLFGSSLRDGNRHDSHNLPLLLAGRGGGELKPSRRLRYKADTPLCNLHLTMIQKMGVAAEKFGDSTGTLDRLS